MRNVTVHPRTNNHKIPLACFDTWSSRARMVLVIGAFAVYALGYIPLRAKIGFTAEILAVIPVVLAGWAFGIQGGLLAGLAVTPLNTILMNLAGFHGWDVVLRETGGLGSIAAIVIGIFTGYWSDLTQALRQQIVQRKQVEGTLQESEERWQFALEGAGDGIWDWNLQTHRIFLSEQLKIILGYEGIGIGNSLEEWDELVHPEDRDKVHTEISKHIAGQSPIYLSEHRVRCMNGTYKWILDRGKVIRWTDDGVPFRVIGTYTDITERKRTEEAFLESEQRFSVLSAAAFEGIVISDQGVILDVNEQFAGMFRGERSEMIGRPVGDFVAPESLDTVLQHIRSGSEEPYEHLSLRKDGSTFPVEIRAKSLPYKGRIVRVTAVRDISERKEAEVELHRRAEETGALLETSLALTNLDLETILPTIGNQAKSLFDSDGCRIFLMEPGGETLRCVLALQENPIALLDLKIKVGEGITGAVAASGQAEIVNDMLHDPRAMNVPGTPEEQEAIMFAPLKAQNRTIGVLSIRRVGTQRPLKPVDLGLLEAFASMASSAVSNARLLEETQRRLLRLSTLRQIDQVIASNLDLEMTLNIILGHISQQLEVDAATVLLYKPEEQSLKFVAGLGFRTQALHFTNLRLGQGFAGRAALDQRIIQISDLKQIHTGFLRSPDFLEEKFVSYIGAPLIAKGNIVGVLEVYHRHAFEPDREWMEYLSTLVGQTAIAINNIHLFNDLQSMNLLLHQAYDATIEGWAQALEMRDMETKGHSNRTVDLTVELARRMGIEESQLVHVRRGALLHDIGKMGVPDSILQKPGKLTSEEWEIMHQHPVYAYKWLAPITYLQPALDIPYYHHEKWDGSGYPLGLKQDQIPLAARIFAVIDVWDTLRSERPYQSGLSDEETLEYIREQSGKHFDPHVVEAFLSLLKK